MAIEFLKKAAKTPQSGEEDTRRIVMEILSAIESGGEDKVREYAEKLDHYTGNSIVTPEEIAEATCKVPDQLKDDLRFAYDRVRTFRGAATREHDRVRVRNRTGVVLWTALDSDGNRRMLCPRRPLRPCRLGDHEHHHSEGCRSWQCRGLFASQA